ncbi:hypothetical protein L218DRAFT_338531 [Marasmius fiardii PR-910]|nr:hypothetical protein L218DRAFT_338531 [Marasmius fiardii PR-910]
MFPRAPSHSLFHPSLYPDPSRHIHSQTYPISTPPNMDPSAVDFRAFYPYTPNEVKHRKRTTSAQLKVLEGIFKHDTKPNAALRNELAAQLDMTARGVQVWFQNRRAKEKTKASKAVASTTQPSSASSDTAPQDAVHRSENAPELSSFPRDLPELSTEPSSQESSPTGGSPPHLQLITDSSSHASWQSSPLATPDDFRQQGDFSDVCFIRRGSLPVDAFPMPDDCQGPPLVGHLDPFTRRRSVDASLHRLAHNPYAGLARAKHSGLAGPRISGHLNHNDNFSSGRTTSLPHHTGTHSGLQLSQHGSLHTRHSSIESRPFRCSPPSLTNSSSPSPLSPYYSIRSSLPDNSLYAFSSRSVASPIPGPLPSPDFSFGAPGVNLQSSESDRGSPDSSHGYLFRGDDLDTEDDATSASYDGFSRFGSIASVANSDSSNTSAYYSEVGSCVSEHELRPESRRPSCTSSHFIGLMSGLNVANEAQGNSPNSLFEQSHPMSLKENDRAPAYPSPTSTISRGASPPGANPANTTVASSNELTYPMQPNDQSVINLHSGSPILDGETAFYNQDNNNFSANQFGEYHPFTDGQDSVEHYSPEGFHPAQESYCMNTSLPASQFL